MDTLRQNYFPITIGYVLLSGLLVSLALVFNPNGRTISFWTSLGVMEVILLVAFGVVAGLVYVSEPDKHSYRTGGPAAGLLKAVLYYVVATLVLMGAAAAGDVTQKLDLGQYLKLVQPLLSIVVVLYAVWIQWTRSSKDSAEDALANQGDGPRNLAALIRSTERRIKKNQTTQPLLDHLSGLYDYLKFQLPVGGKVMANSRYKALVVKIRRLMSEISDDPSEAMCADWIQRIAECNIEAEQIRGEVKM